MLSYPQPLISHFTTTQHPNYLSEPFDESHIFVTINTKLKTSGRLTSKTIFQSTNLRCSMEFLHTKQSDIILHYLPLSTLSGAAVFNGCLKLTYYQNVGSDNLKQYRITVTQRQMNHYLLLQSHNARNVRIPLMYSPQRSTKHKMTCFMRVAPHDFSTAHPYTSIQANSYLFKTCSKLYFIMSRMKACEYNFKYKIASIAFKCCHPAVLNCKKHMICLKLRIHCSTRLHSELQSCN